jgi:hypothetical protein
MIDSITGIIKEKNLPTFLLKLMEWFLIYLSV